MASGDARPLAVAWDFIRFDGEMDRREEPRIDASRHQLFIPAGACVKRLVRAPARGVTVKVPSSGTKIHCDRCSRDCRWRAAPFVP